MLSTPQERVGYKQCAIPLKGVLVGAHSTPWILSSLVNKLLKGSVMNI